MAAQQKIAPIKATTQEFLEIEDISDDLVIFKDGSCTLIIETSAVNFGLLSEEEQDAIIYAYAAFINSLSFPMQICIMSKRMDVSSYLDLVAQEEQKQQSLKLKNQIRKYYQFILSVVKENRVLEKKFYISIPFSSLELGVGGSLNIFGSKKSRLPFPKEYIVQRAKTALFPKRDHLLRQLNRLGLKGNQLNTKRLTQLFYEVYNPTGSESQHIEDIPGINKPLVESETVAKDLDKN